MNGKPLLWIVAVIVALVAGWQLASAQGEKAKGQKWEYKVISGGKAQIPAADLLKELADLGDVGWELVAVEPATKYSHGNNLLTTERVFHLKRAK